MNEAAIKTSPEKCYIVADKVCKSFGTHQVLKEVSTSFNTGEVTVIIGASGSGKSTLLRAINRLEPHDSGTITVAGVPVTDNEATLQKQRCEVGMVFQQFNLFGNMTVLDNITLAPRRIRGFTREQANAKAMTLLTRVGLQEHAHKYPWQLSGGQQQRVAIARALAMAPKVMLFDEPTSALDPEMVQEVLPEARELLAKVGLSARADYYPAQLSGGQQQRVAIARALAMEPQVLLCDEITSALDPELVGEVLRVVESLAQEGMTLMMVTHEMAFARKVSDRVIFMHQGRVHEQGTPAQLFGCPQTPELQQFLSSLHD